ncbi:CPBP family intramembrane metalloprotease [Leucobacter sp. UT-8R-CII-1-4]|uniref:CPBP family intramembrane glutamic endopeptidase n=1 Tax=Leucobacter sp. UT-8R-CII-1-4 TaxID=3040075 RepID=UPI0024A824E4|nr:CPBP family intramembrane glutamic endopeptidase [Leucobacter sp. UT-8R-CII-1-4]MDI6022264.1 CPBP family intramembrane metalloprotease [Leucobacter sp. UT-8R-CII-1-4]
MGTTALRLSVKPWHTIAASLTVLAAPAFFVFEDLVSGFVLLTLGMAAAYKADRGGCDPNRRFLGRGAPSLLRDLSLIAIGLLIVRTISLAAELGNIAMLKFTLALGGAVLVPYLVSRFIYQDRATGFPWRAGQRWGKLHWGWLAAVLVLGWLILPFYFIGSGVYQNWPVVDSPELIVRLFVGVGAVGIWDELFFICTVFAVLLRHFPAWLANVLQAVVFVSFLWELGYRAWGPLLTIPFALVQGVIFLRTKSLGYVVTVHLLFDAVVFAVLVHAHNPTLFQIFPTAP